MKSVSLKLVLLCTLILSGCGFHLRGRLDMPRWLNHVAVIVQNAQPDLEPLLNEQLRANNIQVSASLASARYWLIIEQDQLQQRINSISSSTTPRQYQLIYTLRFKLQQAQGKEIIPLKSIVTIRELTVNSNRILGSNDEAAILENEMRHDAVIQVINQIGALVR